MLRHAVLSRLQPKHIIPSGPHRTPLCVVTAPTSPLPDPHHASQIDPLAPKPRALDLLQLFRVLQSAERDAGQAVRDSEWESREIARVRAGQEQSIALEVPYYDVARVKVRHTEA